MAHQKVASATAACLKLEMKNVVLVKPSKSVPSSTLSLTMIDNKVDLDSLCPVVYAYRSSAACDHDSFDPADVIREALSKALLYYYPLAGRLMRDVNDGKLRVVIKQESANEFGVPFIEANANCDLSSLHYLDGVDTEIAKHFHLPPPPTPSSQCHPPLVFMVTKFLCGGFTIGIGFSHALCDGFGILQFFQAMLELARGRSEPSIKPIWERETLGKAMIGMGSLPKLDVPLQNRSINMSSSAISPLVLPNTVVRQVCIKVDNETIRRLKLGLMNEIGKNEFFTTFDSFAACLWRSRARALNLSTDGKTMLHFLVGLRDNNNFNSLLENFHCPLPEGYCGNVFVDAKAIVTVKELNEKPLSEIVKLIKETKKLAFTDGFIRSWFAKTKKNEPYDFELEASGAVTVLTEWKSLGLMENVDFRGKEAVNVVPAPCDMFTSVSMCILSSNKSNVVVHPKGGVGSDSGGDGLRIFTTLPVAAIPKFREEMNATFSLYSNTTSKM